MSTAYFEYVHVKINFLPILFLQAKEFLKLWKQFEELGFKGDDIKRELIVHGNNEEKVLDSLTAS